MCVLFDQHETCQMRTIVPAIRSLLTASEKFRFVFNLGLFAEMAHFLCFSLSDYEGI